MRFENGLEEPVRDCKTDKPGQVIGYTTRTNACYYSMRYVTNFSQVLKLAGDAGTTGGSASPLGVQNAISQIDKTTGRRPETSEVEGWNTPKAL